MAAAASLPTFSVTDSTSTVSVFAPKRMEITSPTFTSQDARCTRPLTVTRSASQA